MEIVKITKKKIKKLYVYECCVFDEENNKYYYVVGQYDNLFFGTYKSSYIDYLKGKTKKPKLVEGDKYLWIDLDKNNNETRFYEIYKKVFYDLGAFQTAYDLKMKYAHIKKPLNNIKYAITNKKKTPLGKYDDIEDCFEIEFNLLEENKHFYVCYYSADDLYVLSNESIFDSASNIYNSIEYFVGFNKAKKSIYYDLYLEIEKFKDKVI